MAESVAARRKLVAAQENGTGFRLQHCLVELIDLGLHAKQAQWNVTGPNFRSLHEQFDEIAGIARESTDRVAERLAALEVSPDGSVATVGESPLEPFPLGWLSSSKAIDAMLERLQQLSRKHRTRIEEIGGIDPVSQNILVDVVGRIDKAAWMLRVQQP